MHINPHHLIEEAIDKYRYMKGHRPDTIHMSTATSNQIATLFYSNSIGSVGHIQLCRVIIDDGCPFGMMYLSCSVYKEDNAYG